jgi:hypothetical protein
VLGADLRTIPAELRALPRWLGWKSEERKGWSSRPGSRSTSSASANSRRPVGSCYLSGYDNPGRNSLKRVII